MLNGADFHPPAPPPLVPFQQGPRSVIFVAGADGSGHRLISDILGRLPIVMPSTPTEDYMFEALWWGSQVRSNSTLWAAQRSFTQWNERARLSHRHVVFAARYARQHSWIKGLMQQRMGHSRIKEYEAMRMRPTGNMFSYPFVRTRVTHSERKCLPRLQDIEGLSALVGLPLQVLVLHRTPHRAIASVNRRFNTNDFSGASASTHMSAVDVLCGQLTALARRNSSAHIWWLNYTSVEDAVHSDVTSEYCRSGGHLPPQLASVLETLAALTQYWDRDWLLLNESFRSTICNAAHHSRTVQAAHAQTEVRDLHPEAQSSDHHMYCPRCTVGVTARRHLGGATVSRRSTEPVNWCSLGIQNGNDCCASSCGRCRVSGCGQLPGGRPNCCGERHFSGRMCADATDVACTIPEGRGLVLAVEQLPVCGGGQEKQQFEPVLSTLVRSARGERISFTHVINPFDAGNYTEHVDAQRITIESLVAARKVAQAANIRVEVLCVVFSDYVKAIDPRLGFRVVTTNKTMVSMGARLPESALRLPLLSDILRLAHLHGRGKYLIYTNIDIALYHSSYVSIASQLLEMPQPTALIHIREQLYGTHGLGSFSLQEAEARRGSGMNHPGYDCWTFPRAWVPQLRMGDLNLGTGLVAQGLTLALAKETKCRVAMLDGLTFHYTPHISMAHQRHKGRDFMSTYLPWNCKELKKQLLNAPYAGCWLTEKHHAVSRTAKYKRECRECISDSCLRG